MTNTVDITNAELSDQPLVGKESSIINSQLGYACEIGDRCKVQQVTFGDYSYLCDDSDIINAIIGKFCSIAAHTRINPGNHPLHRVSSHHFSYRASRYGFGNDEPAFFQWRAAQPVIIGHDVWIGHGAIILAGVTIGNGAAIGAGSIVTKDVAPYTVVAGNQATPLRSRFQDHTIEGLEKLQWWNWPATLLAERLQDFRHLAPDDFIHKYQNTGG